MSSDEMPGRGFKPLTTEPTDMTPEMRSTMATKRVEEVSTIDEAKEVIDEVFDDPGDKAVVVEKLNRAVDVPGIGEETEAFIIRQALDLAITAYNAS